MYHLSEKFLESKDFLNHLKSNNKIYVNIFVDIYSEKLYKYFSLVGFNSNHATELVQETLCKFINKLRMTEAPNINNMSSYLFRIAKNCVRDEFRRKRKEKKCLQTYTSVGHSYTIAYATDAALPTKSQILMGLLQKLKDVERDVVIFHIVLGKTFEETSDILNMSLSKTKRIFYKALENLRILYFSKVNA